MTDRAKIAYLAYGKTPGNKNFRGEEMPKFEDLPEKIQLAWANAAQAVANDVAKQQAKKSSQIIMDEFYG